LSAPGPPFAILAVPIASTGVSVSHGQSAGFLGAEHDPVFPLQGTDDLMIRLTGESPGGLDPARLRSPNAVAKALDQAECAVEQLASEGKLDTASEQAFASICSPGSKMAVDL